MGRGKKLRLIHYKKPAHVITEAGKSQDLQGDPISGKPRRVDGLATV